MQKPKTWSHDQHIEYELARHTISSLVAILRRQAYVTKDVMKKDVMKTRARELAQEKYNFDGFDDILVKKVNDTYSYLETSNLSGSIFSDTFKTKSLGFMVNISGMVISFFKIWFMNSFFYPFSCFFKTFLISRKSGLNKPVIFFPK